MGFKTGLFFPSFQVFLHPQRKKVHVAGRRYSQQEPEKNQKEPLSKVQFSDLSRAKMEFEVPLRLFSNPTLFFQSSGYEARRELEIDLFLYQIKSQDLLSTLLLLYFKGSPLC